MTTPDAQGPTQADVDFLNAKVDEANNGDREALEWLRDFLDRNPQVWQQVGDLARTAESAWLQLITNGDSLGKEAVKRRAEMLRNDLLGDESTVAEQLIVETIVASWLELHHIRAIDADPKGRTVGQTSAMLKRLESAQRRHFAALKQLSQLRKLLPKQSDVPPLRVWTAEERSA